MKDTVTFLVNSKQHKLRSVDPNLTLLDYLRSQDMTGTKEGCAEGDCGACTAVVAHLNEDGRVELKAVNTCVLFAATLDGRAVITVEGLQSAGGQLHPCQQAMVDCHGSQCGFCTPGFIMSLFAAHQNHKDYNRSRIEEALVGNLCRCTGYAPILEASEKMYSIEASGAFDSHAVDRLQTELDSIVPREDLRLENDNRVFLAPVDVDSMAGMVEQHPDARILAGGTDLGLLVTKLHQKLQTVISTQNVSELKSIEHHDEGLQIGAAVTYTRLMPILKEFFPSFHDLVFRLGSLQIRNQATMGGNLVNASPIGDSAPALLALGARVQLQKGNQIRELDLSDFFVDYRQTALRPGEFLKSLFVPWLAEGSLFRCYKLSKRLDQDISSLLGVFHIRLWEGVVQFVRVGFGGMAATPVRAFQTEEFLLGRQFDESTVHLAAQVLSGEFQPMSDFRGSSQYRRLAAGNLLKKFQLEMTGTDVQIGVSL